MLAISWMGVKFSSLGGLTSWLERERTEQSSSPDQKNRSPNFAFDRAEEKQVVLVLTNRAGADCCCWGQRRFRSSPVTIVPWSALHHIVRALCGMVAFQNRDHSDREPRRRSFSGAVRMRRRGCLESASRDVRGASCCPHGSEID